jgi:hypothetical protein
LTRQLLVLVAVLLAGLFLGGWAALWWRDRIPKNLRHLIRTIYIHCDETLGATKTENVRRANRRFMVERWLGQGTKQVRQADGRTRSRKKLGTAIADFFWFEPQYGGVTTRPSVARMGHYVQVTPDRRTIILRYTSEAAANGANFIEWLERGRPREGGGLAQALGLEWRSGMFEVHKDFSRARVTFTRVKPVAVDDNLRAEEDLA